MQGLQLDESRSDAAVMSSLLTESASQATTSGLFDTLQQLREIQDHLAERARSVPMARLTHTDGPSPAAMRVRRARQAAAIQSAVHVLQELLREQEFLGAPIPAR